MTAERWQVVKRILEEALARDPSLRSAHVAAACAGDEGLRRDVESFLADEQSDEFLERPALGRAPRVPDSALRATVTTKPGQVDNVRPIDLVPYTKLVVSTRGSRYELIAVAPLDREFLVRGGRRFPETTRARLYCQDSIRVGEELWLVVGTRKVVTTRITTIEVVD